MVGREIQSLTKDFGIKGTEKWPEKKRTPGKICLFVCFILFQKKRDSCIFVGQQGVNIEKKINERNKRGDNCYRESEGGLRE